MTNQIIRGGEAQMIRRLCEAYIRVDNEKQKKKKAGNGVPSNATNVTTMKDSAGIAAIFRNAGSDRPKSKKSPSTPGGIPPPA